MATKPTVPQYPPSAGTFLGVFFHCQVCRAQNPGIALSVTQHKNKAFYVVCGDSCRVEHRVACLSADC